MELKPGKGLAEGPWTLALAAGMIVGFCAICSYVLFDLRRAGWDQAHSAATNLATAIQSEIARNVELYDLSLQGVVENRTEPEIGWISPRVRNLLLFDRAATAKYMGAILLLDEQGRVVADSTNPDAKGGWHGDMDYFAAHRLAPIQGLYISELAVDKFGEYVIGISRRVTHADGSFAGVVVGTLRLQYFRDLFSKMNLGAESAIALIRTDGTLLAREPFRTEDMGRVLATGETASLLRSDQRGHYIRRVSPVDNIERLYVYKQVGELPLVISVGLATWTIESAWRQIAVFVAILMAALAGGIATFVERLRTESRRRTELERELAALAQTDALTKLPNRRGLDIVMEREFKRAERTGEIVGLLLVDADRFKSFNDMFGHQAGDELLRRFADCIADAARRGTDFAARYGGEEFAVLITGIKPGMLESVAETVRANIHALAMHHPAGPGGIATVSIGMACVTSGDTLATLIAGADKALYAAKSAGRDTILADDSVRMLASSHIRLAA